jgi:hypothetical protein
MDQRHEQADDGVDGFAVSATSANGWVTVRRDAHRGEVEVRVKPGSLRGRTEEQVAAEIRSGLLAAARAYTQRHRDELRRRYGELPEEIRTWGRTP